METALAGPHPLHGGWTYPKGYPRWRACIQEETQWASPAALQGRLHEEHEGTSYHYGVLGKPCSWPHEMEKHPEPIPQNRGKEADQRCGRQTDTQEGVQQLKQINDHIQI
ncbi:hypothetical protein chiPu_0004780 [Chiloscyllium punctatum]|uniref:Uncharacterized protein n=1 Tax=Chiloscyllium punctatum TaxID=137246 RepID=A0A401S7J2_CHIPU|nr:hypothetical protein [Chiloscyllium punctatum]